MHFACNQSKLIILQFFNIPIIPVIRPPLSKSLEFLNCLHFLLVPVVGPSLSETDPRRAPKDSIPVPESLHSVSCYDPPLTLRGYLPSLTILSPILTGQHWSPRGLLSSRAQACLTYTPAGETDQHLGKNPSRSKRNNGKYCFTAVFVQYACLFLQYVCWLPGR